MKAVRPKALKPRKTPLQARSIATVDAIFKATIQVLLTDGAVRLTTTRVAERAGVSVGTMYQYFPHKQSLLYAVVQQHLNEFIEEFETACMMLAKGTLISIADGIANAFLDIKIRQPDVTQALYKLAAELDTEALRAGTAKRLQDACTKVLDSAVDVKFSNLSDISFTLLTAMNGTTRAVFEFGAQPHMIHVLRTQLLVLCRGYLQIAGEPSIKQHKKPINKSGCKVNLSLNRLTPF